MITAFALSVLAGLLLIAAGYFVVWLIGALADVIVELANIRREKP